MQIIFDNLAAMIVVSILILLLFGYSLRAQNELTQTTNDNLLRKQQLAFIELLQQDLSSATGVQTILPTSSDTTFVFYTRVGADTTTKEVVYDLEKVGQRDGADLFQVERRSRKRWGGGALEPNGGSMPLLTGWYIEGLNQGGSNPSGPADVRQIRVTFETVMPLDYDDDSNRRRHWETTFRPNGLRPGTGL